MKDRGIVLISIAGITLLLIAGCAKSETDKPVMSENKDFIKEEERREPDERKINSGDTLNKAYELFVKQKFQAATAALEALLKEYPNEPSVLIKSGEIYVSLGEDDKALKNLKKALELKGHHHYGWANRILGIFYKKKQDYKQAEEYLQKAIEITESENDKIFALADLIEVYLMQGKDKLAKKQHELLLKLPYEKLILEKRSKNIEKSICER